MDNPKLLIQEKQLLIFDYDGTLAQTSSFHEHAFQLAFEDLNISFDYNEIAGKKTYDAIKQILDQNKTILDEHAFQELVLKKQALAMEMIMMHLEQDKELTNFLEKVVSSHKLYVVSSGSRNSIMEGINKLQYSHFFDHIISAEDVKKAKPHPEGFLLALKIAGIEKSDALIFEDSQSGFDAASEAGIEYLDVNSLSWYDLI